MLLRVPSFDEWPTLGWEVIDFIEAYCPHGPGDVQGSEFLLDLEEVQLLLDLYRLYPPDHRRAGRRVVARGMYSRAKGRRKSELAGAIVVAEARGPVRFDGWRRTDDGLVVPVGRPVTAPFIRCLATEESQSGNTYGNVVAMLDHAAVHHPDVFGDVDLGQKVQGSTRVFLRRDAGEIRPSTASSAAKDGGKESFAVEDEPHLYKTPELRSMDATVRRNLMKRKIAEPWLLRTSTSYRPGEQSVAEAHHDEAKRIVEGAAPAGSYLNHREGPKPADWDDDAQVMAMLVEAYGTAAEWMDLERMLEDEIRNPEADQGDSQRYFGNLSSTTSDAAFSLDRWRELTRADLVVADRELVVAGFDGSRVDDATGLIATHVASGHQWTAGIWYPDPDTGEIDEADVDLAVEQLFDRFEVWRLYGDPPYWESALDRWAGRWGEKRVVRWWTNRYKPMAYALKAYALAQTVGDLSHDGDTRFAAHIGNARKRWHDRLKDEEGRLMWTIRKEFPTSPNKIDAAMAGCLSWEARGDCIASGELERWQRRHRSEAFFL